MREVKRGLLNPVSSPITADPRARLEAQALALVLIERTREETGNPYFGAATVHVLLEQDRLLHERLEREGR